MTRAEGIPGTAGKVSLDSIDTVRKVRWRTAEDVADLSGEMLLTFERKDLRFDLLWRPKPGATRMFVLFSGDAQRAKNNLPVFQRWSWAEHFPGHCVYVSDPTLWMASNMSLAWYAGNEAFDPMPVICDRLRKLANGVGLTERDIYAYGSSGGGFAGIKMLTLLPEACAVAVNPQICITDYLSEGAYKNVNRFLRVCFDGRSREAARAAFPERLNLHVHAEALSGRRMMLGQNVLDAHHYEVHYKPFCAALGVGAEHAPDDGPVRRILFSHEGGHRKAEDQETFATVLSQIEADA